MTKTIAPDSETVEMSQEPKIEVMASGLDSPRTSFGLGGALLS